MGFKERDLKNIDEVIEIDEVINKPRKRNIEVRINSGIYANRKIYVASANMRPTLARAKTILFDILMALVSDKFTILDVFAGTGAIGLEALSRGASKAVFIEINKRNAYSIERNFSEMDKLNGRGVVIQKSALRPIPGSPVNVVFIDPPYEKSGLISDVIEKLYKNNWIDENTIIVCECHKSFKFILSDQYAIFRERKVSSSIFYFVMLKRYSLGNTMSNEI